MFSQKFKELEEKIKSTTELITRLKYENREWEQKYHAAEKHIHELETELERLRNERERVPPITANALPSIESQGETPGDKAAKHLQELIAQDTNNYRAYFDLGYLYEKQGQYDKAIAEYRKALQIKPDFLDATEHLAFLLEKLNRDSEASPLWERILSLKKRG